MNGAVRRYWHEHVDKVTYRSFDYTCLLYLSDHGLDFSGGEFQFVTKTKKTKSYCVTKF